MLINLDGLKARSEKDPSSHTLAEVQKWLILRPGFEQQATAIENQADKQRGLNKAAKANIPGFSPEDNARGSETLDDEQRRMGVRVLLAVPAQSSYMDVILQQPDGLVAGAKSTIFALAGRLASHPTASRVVVIPGRDGRRLATVPVVNSSEAAPKERRLSVSPSSQFRHRHGSRIISPIRGNLRRATTFSDTLSEARESIKTSTDDVLRPRVSSQTNDSNWQSAPLVLALLPAIGGIFFKDGGALLTDVTLLCLAAVFLNWSVRLPWDWYHSARATVVGDSNDDLVATGHFPKKLDGDSGSDTALAQKKAILASSKSPRPSDRVVTASQELYTHESIALASCFLCPLLGTWMLHTIRSQLSRPAGGLVSNYNLSVFLLAAEIRPFSHVLKMIQARTLHLQRVVKSASRNQEMADPSKLVDMAGRLDALDAFVSGLTSSELTHQTAQVFSEAGKELDQKIRQIDTQTRKAIQGDIAALTRAVRKYEKRLTMSELQTNARFNNLESHIYNISPNNAIHAKPEISPSFLWALGLATSFRNALVLPWRMSRAVIMLPVLATTWWFSLLVKSFRLDARSDISNQRRIGRTGVRL
ncbi:predicted protein [Uncinocarpus reesii 1704]|uniref:Uncharacterized protein n=1 Tax=Uncinocarpus reesii (strain UAMH 1704) TaxID=336963 RepID=C4JN23_UNCRE|nr:uncharacterized protein UREG_04231 [Uncinocarpus reesii 1704]EEP79385.1 predicted protein [Uncinocarpus reesii 1704]